LSDENALLQFHGLYASQGKNIMANEEVLHTTKGINKEVISTKSKVTESDITRFSTNGLYSTSQELGDITLEDNDVLDFYGINLNSTTTYQTSTSTDNLASSSSDKTSKDIADFYGLYNYTSTERGNNTTGRIK
jgi:hypothetical protein